MKLSGLFTEFFNSEKAGGLILVACTFVSLVIANTTIGDQYIHFWHTEVVNKPVEFWINDASFSCW
jgi:Na+:H+ antiporter, NhaA family